MCGVIGFKTPCFNLKQMIILKHLFCETKIRGMHATGISYIVDNKLITIKEAIPADQFISQMDLQSFLGKELCLIGHCRYSTSSIEFNQPISNDQLAIVHNGIITQSHPSTWKQKYGYNFKTENDTEILFHSLLDCNNPFKTFEQASLAVITLDFTKDMLVFRNGKRPLWYSEFENVKICSSTSNILNAVYSKSHVKEFKIKKLEAGIIFRLTDTGLQPITKKVEMVDIN